MVKNSPFNAGDIRDVGSISGLGRSPGEGHGNTHQYSCLENPMDKLQSIGLPRTDTTEVTLQALSHIGCVRLCDPMDCTPPGSSFHGILHALENPMEWIAMPFSRGSS